MKMKIHRNCVPVLFGIGIMGVGGFKSGSCKLSFQKVSQTWEAVRPVAAVFSKKLSKGGRFLAELLPNFRAYVPMPTCLPSLWLACH